MSRLFTIASDKTLCAMIQYAQDKLIIVAPGLSQDVASAVADRIKRDDGPTMLSIIIDIDPEVYRLGYGDMRSIDILRNALELRNEQIQIQKGVRIGLIVADTEILAFAPTPRYIESGSNSQDKPNAIRITESCAMDIPVACGSEEDFKSIIKQEVGLDFATEKIIEETRQDLEDNPPRVFDLVRLERVFNYSLEFVEFSVENFKLNTRSVQIPPQLLGLVEKKLQERIRNSFRVFENETPFVLKAAVPHPPFQPETNGQRQLDVTPAGSLKIELSETWLSTEAARIRKDYFIPLGSSAYGNLILKRNKTLFVAEIERLKKLVELYAMKVRESIEAKILTTRDALIKDLFPRIKASPPRQWINQSVDGKLSDATIRKRLEVEIAKVFQQVEKKFAPQVIVVFKGVTYETITNDPHFQEKVLDYFGEDETEKLFSQYDASRAKERE